MARSLRILIEATWPNDVVTRLWDGSGPYVDAEMNVWRGSSLVTGLDAIEAAINGEAYTLNMSLTGVQSEIADNAWLSYEHDELIGGIVKIMFQPCDDDDQPVGDPQVRFTGTVDNLVIDDTVAGDRPESSVTFEVTNRFTLRRLTHGAVLSDADQRARSAAVNPEAEPDRFCERVPLLEDKTIVWPRWN